MLGFEFGYSLDMPEGLVIWEAQFGDFVNAAQVIIDQFLVSSEAKWHRVSGLVMLLPHGMEGQGPEHSSARLERFLNLCVNDNIQVCNVTTPAQYLPRAPAAGAAPLPQAAHRHVARRACCAIRRRLAAERLHRRAASSTSSPTRRSIRSGSSGVLLCSGKIYYDLVAAREERRHDDVAIVRVEQLYPSAQGRAPRGAVGYAEGTPVVWVQEEPQNMGAWRLHEPRAAAAAPELVPLVGGQPAALGQPGDRLGHAAHAASRQRLWRKRSGFEKEQARHGDGAAGPGAG